MDRDCCRFWRVEMPPCANAARIGACLLALVACAQTETRTPDARAAADGGMPPDSVEPSQPASGEGGTPDARAAIDGGSRADGAEPWQPVPSECRLEQDIELSAEAAYGSGSPIRSDGRYVYYQGIMGSDLRRVPVNGGASESLHESVAAFTVAAGHVYYATYLGEVGEVLAEGQARVIAQGAMAWKLDAMPGFLYFCGDPFTTGNEPAFRSIALDSGAVEQVVTEGRVGCPAVTAEALYWATGAADFPTGLVRADLAGRDARPLVEDPSGVSDWTASGDSFAVASGERIVLGQPSTGSTVEIAVDAPQHLTFAEDYLYFERTTECIPMPDFGNGQPACRDEILRVARDGGEVEQVRDIQVEVESIALDSACLYWIEVPTPCHPACIASLHAGPR